MVQCYSTGDGNVSFHKGTLVPPGEYDWTCASFGPLESTTDTANGSVQSFLHSLPQKVPILYNGRPYPPELPLPWGTWTSHVTHDAFGPYESTTQTAPRSVQPSLHRWLQTVNFTLRSVTGCTIHTAFLVTHTANNSIYTFSHKHTSPPTESRYCKSYLNVRIPEFPAKPKSFIN